MTPLETICFDVLRRSRVKEKFRRLGWKFCKPINGVVNNEREFIAFDVLQPSGDKRRLCIQADGIISVGQTIVDEVTV